MANSVLIIEELSGRKRKLELRGAGLPFQGAEWAASQTLATQWNPGNSEATQHVLGPQELPSNWEGEWNTTRIIAAPCMWSENGGPELDVVLADSLRDLLDDIRMTGQLLRVTWVAKENRRVTRLGRISEVHFKHTRADDIKWNAEFVWVGRGTGSKGASQFKGDNLLARSRELAQAASDLAAGLEAAAFINANGKQKAVSTFTLGQLEQFVDGPLVLVDSLARFANAIANRARHLGEIIQKIRDTPAAIYGRAADTATNAIAVANQFCDAISRESPETMSTRNKVSSMLRASAYYGDAQTQAELMEDIALQLGKAAKARQMSLQQGSTKQSGAGPSDILTVYLPRAGDTMLSIALKFYGSDLSYELSKANGLPGSTITPPKTALIIPTLEVLNKQKGTSV